MGVMDGAVPAPVRDAEPGHDAAEPALDAGNAPDTAPRAEDASHAEDAAHPEDAARTDDAARLEDAARAEDASYADGAAHTEDASLANDASTACGGSGQAACGCIRAMNGPLVERTDHTLWSYETGLKNVPLPHQPTKSDGSGPLLPISFSAGWGSACAVESSGYVWCWSLNTESSITVGELGDGTTQARLTPVRVLTSEVAQTPLVDMISVSVDVNSRAACAFSAVGAVYCWGDGTGGKLGNGFDGPLSVRVAGPVLTREGGPQFTGAVELALGSGHSCARKSDGSVWCWGSNTAHQIDPGNSSSVLYPKQITALGNDVLELSASSHSTCARKADGSVHCWGRPGDLGRNADYTDTTPKPVPRDAEHALERAAALVPQVNGHCALLPAGGSNGVWCWGASYPIPYLLQGMPAERARAIGRHFRLVQGIVTLNASGELFYGDTRKAPIPCP